MLRFVKGWKTTLWGGCGAIALALITPTLAGEIPPRTSQSAASASFQPGSVEGQLASDGDTLNDGRHYQVHVLEGQAEQQVTIKLTSHEFAPYLVVLDPEGHKIAEAGDGGATNQARIVTTLLKEGTYTLVASSQAAAATGRYTLSWQAASSEEAPLAEAGKLSQQIAELSAQGNYPEAIALAEQLLTLRKTIQSGDRPEIATSLNTLAFLYQSQGRSGEAEPLYTEALAMRRRLYEGDHPNIALSLNNLAALYEAQGKYGKAEPLLTEALVMRRRLYEGDHADVALSLNNLASLYQSQSQYSQAQPLLTEALAMRQRLFEGDHPDIALSLNNLAALYEAQGKYSEAEPLYTQALAMQQRLYEGDHPDVATSLNNLAGLYKDQGKYRQAEPLYTQALAMWQRLFEGDHPNIALSLNNLASLYDNQGRSGEAEPLYTQALTMWQRLFEGDHPNIAINLDNLATLYESQGRYGEAEDLSNQALAMWQRLFEGDHPNVASSMNNLATLYEAQGRYSEAEPLYTQALAMWQRLFEGDHPLVATSLNNLAFLHLSQGRYREAEDLSNQALAMWQRLFEGDHPKVATSLNNLAGFYQARGRYSEADPLYTQALAMRRRLHEGDHPDVATSLNNLALLYTSQERYSEAEPLHTQALTMRQRLYEGDHPDIAISLTNLAALHEARGEYSKAEPLYSEALAMHQRLFADEHPKVALSLNNLANLYQNQNNISRALEFLSRGTDVEEKNLSLNLIAGTEAQKRAFLATFSGTTDATISIHLQQAPDNFQAARLALTTILRRKGRVLDTVADTYSILRDRLAGEDVTVLDKLAATRAQLQALELNGAGDTPREEYREQLATLRTAAEDLETQLFQRSAEFRRETQTVTIAAIQPQIPADAALVEFIRYEPFIPRATQPEEQWGPPRYAAYVLTARGEPQWVDLGNAEMINQLVNEFRRQIAQAPSASAGLRKRASRQVKAAARRLDEQVMQPVRQLLGDTDNLLLSPDSQLNLIPFGALVDESDRYLVETYTITYLTSGRDLLQLESTTAPQQAPVVVANPDYQTEADSQQSNQKTELAMGDRQSADLRSLDSCCSPLAGTQQEVEAIAPLLPEVNVFTESEATEAMVKDVEAPSLLHIASHGFFLPAQATDESTRELGTAISETSPARENPLLRSGLALAGFNPSQGKLDGALTALEVTNINLWGTKLVVLSACSTGVGEVVDGEGVYGLRRALVIAGTESQVISLWNVSDFGTTDLMTSYYQKLLTGAGRSEALRQTQLELLNSDEYGHPFYWAAFIPSGNWTAMNVQELAGRGSSRSE